MKRATYWGGKRALNELLPAADTKVRVCDDETRNLMAINADELMRISDKYEATICRVDPTTDGRNVTVIRCDRDCGVREVIFWGMDTLEPLMYFFEMIWNCEYFIDTINEYWRMFLKKQNVTDEGTLKRIDYVAFPTNMDTLHEGEATYLLLSSRYDRQLNTEIGGVPVTFNMLGDLPGAIEWLAQRDVPIKIASHDTFTHPDCVEHYGSKFAGQGEYESVMDHIAEKIGEVKSADLCLTIKG